MDTDSRYKGMDAFCVIRREVDWIKLKFTIKLLNKKILAIYHKNHQEEELCKKTVISFSWKGPSR